MAELPCHWAAILVRHRITINEKYPLTTDATDHYGLWLKINPLGFGFSLVILQVSPR